MISSAAVQVHTAIAVHKGSSFLLSWSVFVAVLLVIAILTEVRWNCEAVLNRISSMAKDV